MTLRNHIPIASPARREPADGTESPLRVSLGFEPSWYRERFDADFSERWHRDPVYRFETRWLLRAELERRFPETDYWRRLNDPDLASLSGCHGIGVIPAVFGVPIRYHPDRWPELEPGHRLSIAEIERLDVDRLLQAPFVEELFAQMDRIEAEFGAVHGYLNWQGVLNNAFHLRDEQILLDLAEAPELAERLLDVIAEVMIRLGQRVQARQRASGFAIDQMDVSNCVVNMISPRMYARFVAPRDRRIAESFALFGVHTCNWNVTPYLGELRALPKVGYLDMGMDSDFRRARELFPQARRAVLYDPRRVIEATPEDMRADLTRIAAELAPCDVVLADLPAETRDPHVRRFLVLAAEVETALAAAGV